MSCKHTVVLSSQADLKTYKYNNFSKFEYFYITKHKYESLINIYLSQRYYNKTYIAIQSKNFKYTLVLS